jgi:carbamoyl-phosphate synthase small subunit
MSTAYLVLEDGTTFEGTSFGYTKTNPAGQEGEVVFNTGMTGYPETLTDPSYRGQILTMTSPLIGNYGIPNWNAVSASGLRTHFESDAVHVRGLIIGENQIAPSHHQNTQTLSAFLIHHKIPAISGIDTRELTKKIRETGVMKGKIFIGTIPKTKRAQSFLYDTDVEDLVSEVSTKKVITYGTGKKRICLVDTGCKFNIIRNLLQFDTTVIRVPHDYPFMDKLAEGTFAFDALFIPNGPGNPAMNKKLIAEIKKALDANVNTFGICLGNQLLALAGGCKTKKLKYGHRGQNQPCMDTTTKHSIITSQNHGFAVQNDSMPKNIKPWFINVHDNSNEGIRFTNKQARAVQFHPESFPGPVDAQYLFAEFVNSIS